MENWLCVFLFEPGFGTEFLTPEKIQVASFIRPCMFPDFRRYTTPSRGFTFLCCVDGISNSSLNSCFSSRHAMFTGPSASRTMQGNASAKQVSTTSVYAFPRNNCEFARFTPTLGSALMFLPEKGLFGGLFPKQRLVIKPN